MQTNTNTDRSHRLVRIRALLAALALASLAVAADAPGDLFAEAAPKWAVRPEERNAALIYLSPELATVDRAALAIADLGENNADPLGMTLDASKLPKEFEAARAAINTELVAKIRTATSLAKCDFEIEYEKGYKAAMPGLQNMRNAGRILRIDTRIALTEPAVDTNGDRAAENLAAMYRVARDTAALRTIISSLVAQRVLDLALHETRVYLKSSLADAKGRQKVLAAAAELSEDPLKLLAAMEVEEAMLHSILREHLAAKSPGESLAKAMVDMGNPAESKAVLNCRRAARKDLENAIMQSTEIFRRVRGEWAKPPAEQTGESFDVQVLALGESNLLRSLLPAFDSSYRKCRETESALAEVCTQLAAQTVIDPASDSGPQSVQTDPDK